MNTDCLNMPDKEFFALPIRAGGGDFSVFQEFFRIDSSGRQWCIAQDKDGRYWRQEIRKTNP